MPRPHVLEQRVDFYPEFGRAVRISEYARPMRSDDEDTAQTIALMDQIAAADVDQLSVVAAAYDALDEAGIDDTAPRIDQACAVYWWLKRHIRYVPTPGTSRLVDQTLITPATVLAMPEPIGDCPQFSMLACAMFRVLCIQSWYVTIKAEPDFPNQWSHVYNTVEVFPRQYMPFDSSNGPEPGSEYTKPFAKRIWPRLQPAVCNERSKEKAMLRNTYQQSPPRMRSRTLRRALGDVTCDQDGNCYDDSSGTYTPAAPSDVTLSDLQTLATQGDCAFGVDASGNCLPFVQTTTFPSQSAPTLPATGQSVATTIAGDLTSLLSPISRAIASSATQPRFITGPNGQQILYNPATGQPISTFGSLGTLSPTTLLIGGLLLAAVFIGGKK